tara:strand:+ start:711 stop:965 length:255 start_codon:yes stop_codon:yes gene_type:complete
MIYKAIKKINPDAKFKYENEDINSIVWLEGTTPISKADIEAELANIPTAEEEAQAKADLKASAKAKLVAGEPLTEDEANVMIGG